MAFETFLAFQFRLDPSTEEPLPFEFLLERDPADETELRFEQELDDSILEVALPRVPIPASFTGRQQLADVEVYVDGERVEDVLPTWSIRLPLAGPASWSFSVPYRTRDGLQPTSWRRRFLSPLQTLGAPLGLAAVNFVGVYFHPTAGRLTVPIVTNGLATSCRLSRNGDASTLTFSGSCSWKRWEERIVDSYLLPPGHGLTRGAVARKLGTSQGMTGLILWEGTRSYRELQVVGEPLLRVLEQIADADNMALRMDASDQLIAQPQVDVNGVISWSFGEQDLVRDAEVGVSASSDGPTRVSLAGTEQILRDEEGQGIHTEESVVEVEAVYAPRYAVASQNNDGTINASPGVDPSEAELQITERVTTRITKDGETVIVEEVESEAFHALEVWRYELDNTPEGVDGGGDYQSYNDGCYFYDDGATKNDGTKAYRLPREVFGPVGKQTKTHEYDERGFRVGSETIRHAIVLIQYAIKQRPNPGTTFEATNCETVPVLADGIAVGTDGMSLGGPDGPGYEYTEAESFVPSPEIAEREIETIQVTDDGYITSRRVSVEGWGLGEAGRGEFLFGDSKQRSSDRFDFITLRVEDELYRVTGDLATKTVVRRGLKGIEEIRSEPLNSYLPRADRRQELDPDPEIYESEEEAEFAAAAARTEQKPILFDLAVPALEQRRVRRDLREEFQMAESVEDLEARAVVVLRLGSAATTDFVLPINWLLQPGQRTHLSDREIDVETDVHVVDVQHSRGGENQPMLTTVELGRIYLV